LYCQIYLDEMCGWRKNENTEIIWRWKKKKSSINLKRNLIYSKINGYFTSIRMWQIRRINGCKNKEI
jgi:hypothetical protein